MPDIKCVIFFDDEMEEWRGEVFEDTYNGKLLFLCNDKDFSTVTQAVGKFLVGYGATVD
jgi:hypothetical protein